MSDQRPNYNREPRIQPFNLPSQELTLPSAPKRKSQQERNWLLSVLPMSGIGVMAVFYIFRGSSVGSGADGLIFALPMLMMALFTISGTVIGGRVQQRAAEHQQEAAERDYLYQLEDRRIKLEAARYVQYATLETCYPSVQTILNRVLTEERPYIWERRPEDADFASIRLGLGTITSNIAVMYEEPEPGAFGAEKLMEIADEYRRLENAPVVVHLAQVGSLGVAGPRQRMLELIRAALTQIVVTHAPDELLIVIVTSRINYRDWQWLENVPHTSISRRSGSAELIVSEAADISNLMGVLGQTLDERNSGDEKSQKQTVDATATHLPQYIVVLDGPELIESEAIYETLLRDGYRLGASVIALKGEFDQLPGYCRAVTILEPDGNFTLNYVGGRYRQVFGQSDQLSANDARAITTTMAGLTLRETGDAGRIPRRVNYLDLYNINDVEDLSAKVLPNQWSRMPMKGGLLPFPVPLGRESLTTIIHVELDEDHHGPHGMLAGTTGAGKSELMQTLVSSLIIEHDPRYLTLMLVDFKGGATFGMYRDLPHTVGMVTNLSPELTKRALEALIAEIRERQLFLDRYGVRNINEYHEYYVTRQGGFNRLGYEPLPHLCIIVDEFAQLAKDMPEFMSELVRTVQVGRSLGLHLILGTQSPKEVITQEMEDNIQLRLCLRVQSVQASRTMLGRPDAAYIPSGWAGRGFFQAGVAGIFKQFQTAYVGGEYISRDQLEQSEQSFTDHFLQIDGETIIHEKLSESETNGSTPLPNDGIQNRPLTLAEKIAHIVADYAKEIGLQPARKLLLPPLEERLTLMDLFRIADIKIWDGEYNIFAKSDLPMGAIPIGLTDDVRKRRQDVYYINFTNISSADNGKQKEAGHVLIMGGPSTGKTTTMVTIAVSLALMYPPDQFHIYCISFTGRGLDLIGELPHSVAVIPGTEYERVRRLLLRLKNEINRRQSDLNYAESAPSIVFFLDQYEPFYNAYGNEHLSDLEYIISQGRAARIFVVMSAFGPVIPDRIRNLIRQPIAFTLADSTSYMEAIGTIVSPAELKQIPGRGLVRDTPPLPLQVAFPSLDTKHSQELLWDSVKVLVARLAEGYPHAPPEVNKLEELIPYDLVRSHLKPMKEGITTPLGKRDDDQLTTFWLDWTEGQHYIITGPPGSGKSNTLKTMLLTAAETKSPEDLRILLIDFQRRSLRPLQNLKHVLAFVTDENQLTNELANLREEFNNFARRERKGEQISNFPITVLAIDNFDSMLTMVDPYGQQMMDLQALVQMFSELNLHVLVAGNFKQRGKFVGQIALRQTGFSMVDRQGLEVFDIFPGVTKDRMPVGRGIFVDGSNQTVIQIAESPHDIENIVQELNTRTWGTVRRANWIHPASKEKREAALLKSRSISLAKPPEQKETSQMQEQLSTPNEGFIDIDLLLGSMGLGDAPPSSDNNKPDDDGNEDNNEPDDKSDR